MKYAMVTGGSRGIGRACCLQLAEMGYNVIINYARNQEAAEETRRLVEEKGVTAELMPFDVAEGAAADAAVTAWQEQHPDDYIAILVNNAGIRQDTMLVFMEDRQWHDVLNTTLNGFFYITRRVVKDMLTKRWGRIVNVVSLSGIKGLPGQVNYSAAKAAIIGATKALAQEVGPRNLSVDVLVCNAGMFFMEYLGADNLPKAQTMMALHMNATTELCVLFGERMKAAGSGHILIMSSMTDRIPAPGIAIYSSTKAYLKTFGLSLSYEMRPYGVYVTTVCPAAVDTDLYPLKPGLRAFLKRIGIIKSPRWLVGRALRRMFRGCRIVRPGLSNYLVPLAVALMPARLTDHLGMKWIKTKTL